MQVSWPVAKVKHDNFAGSIICPRFEELCELHELPVAESVSLTKSQAPMSKAVVALIVTSLVLLAVA